METIKKEEVENPKAFPCLDNNEHSGQIKIHSEGMTLRDYFAAKAITGLVSATNQEGTWTATECAEEIALESYKIADAMLRQRQAIEKAL